MTCYPEEDSPASGQGVGAVLQMQRAAGQRRSDPFHPTGTLTAAGVSHFIAVMEFPSRVFQLVSLGFWKAVACGPS